jgi:hypothetical protein
MNRLWKIVLAAAVGIGCLLVSATAAADWHGRVGVYIGPGPFWWGAPYYYPYAYAPPVVVQPAPVYVQPSYAHVPVQPDYWYFCRAANAYYPYVSSCPGGWETVTPQPQGPTASPAPTAPAPRSP